MPLDPTIARGVNPGAGLVEIFQLAESMKERRQQNELYATEQQQRTQLAQQKLQQEQAAAQKEQEDAQAKQELQYFLPLAKQGNPEAMKVIVERASKFQPQLADMYRANPEGVGKALIQAGEQMLGIKPEEAGGIKIGQYNPGDYTPETWAQFVRSQDPAVLRRQYAPPQPAMTVINGVPTIVDKASGTTRPLTTLGDEANAAATIATAKATGTAAGERVAEIEKKIASSATMTDALDIAVTLVPIATGSTVGALADRAAGVFGYTPTGAEATASLRVVAAKVLENVPRMEGPQSDRDVQMYREAAGQLGDPTVTRGEKMAAIRTIRQLTEKYAARNRSRTGSNTPPAAPGGNRVRFEDLP